MTGVRAAVVIGIVLLIGGCAAQAAVPAPEPSGDPVVPSYSEAPGYSQPPGDQPPNAADNNGWKQRHGLSDADRRRAEPEAERIRAALQRVHDGGDMGPDATLRALLGLGYASADVDVQPMRGAVEGAAFGVRVGPVACVIGDVRPSGVRVEVAGSAAEFGCLEPFSH
jgi:hypothetical protein